MGPRSTVLGASPSSPAMDCRRRAVSMGWSRIRAPPSRHAEAENTRVKRDPLTAQEGEMKYGRGAMLGLLISVVGLGVAIAGSAKFHSADSTVNNTGGLVVSWDQRGLG